MQPWELIGPGSHQIPLEKTMTEGHPRRIDVRLRVSAETAIAKAIDEVESLGADTRLTDAVIALGNALDSVAAYVDDEIGKASS